MVMITRFLLLFAIFIGLLNAQGEVFSFEKEDTNVFKPLAKDTFVPTDTKSFFVSYMHTPKKAYVGELIALHVKVITPIKFKEIKIINNSDKAGVLKDLLPLWSSDDGNIYTKTIYFQAKEPLKIVPSFGVELIRDSGKTERSTLPQKEINIIKLNSDEGRFIGVFAKKIQVKKFKTNRFDEKNLIMVMELISNYANIDDINFTNIKRQGFDSKSGKFPDNSVFYYVVIKEGTQSVDFSYFNSDENRFNIISLPVILEQDDLSTQIGLNPKKSRFELYKEIAIGALSVMFLLLFVFRRKFVYAFGAIAFGAYLIFVKVSMHDITLKEGTRVRILPTEKSTMFYTIKKPTKVEKLNEVNSYIKVLLSNGKIGWIKKEDVKKN